MLVAILSIGTELTRGEITNTNASWLADELTSLGFTVVEHATVDDDHGRIVEAVLRLARSVRLVVATGGLGPTTDDLTSEAVAAAAGVVLVRDEASLEGILARWRSFGLEMPPSNAKQADFPAGAEIVANPVGTAPGFSIEIGGCRFFFLPGVPREMRHLFTETVAPAIASLAPRTTHQIHIRTFGMTESAVGDSLAGLESDHPGVTLGYRAHFPEIEVKVLAEAATEAEARSKAALVAEKVRERLGEAVFGGRDDTYPAVLGEILRSNGLKLAVAESCTGGLIGTLLTSTPGSSDYFVLSAVTYSNESKSKVLHVDEEMIRAHGAVSAEVAAAMAEGALRAAGTDMAVAVTGIAGPGGGTEEKPVGTVWFALAQRGKPTVTKTRWIRWDRERVRTLSAYVALRMVARAALGREVDV